MALWDHISRSQREFMASMLEDPDGNGPNLHSLLIRVLDGYAEVLHSGRRLPCLGEIKDDIAAVSPDPWKELRILISPKEGILSLYIADPQGWILSDSEGTLGTASGRVGVQASAARPLLSRWSRAAISPDRVLPLANRPSPHGILKK